MTGRQKLLEYARKRNVFRASDVGHAVGLSRLYISHLAKEGRLKWVGYGLYAFALNENNENQSIKEVAAKVSNGVL